MPQKQVRVCVCEPEAALGQDKEGVYRPLYNETGWWVRPHAMFFEDVVVAGRRQPRFARVPD